MVCDLADDLVGRPCNFCAATGDLVGRPYSFCAAAGDLVGRPYKAFYMFGSFFFYPTLSIHNR